MKQNKLMLCIITIGLIIATNIPIVIQDYSTVNTCVTQSQSYKIVRVVDGDTIVINYNGVKEKVRLLMIDTPESVNPKKEKNTSMGAISSEHTKSLLENKNVELEFDKSYRDRYDRLLAYVYCDGIFINEKLVHDGYAKVVIYEPNHKYKDILYKAQDYAIYNKLGIWK